ncbi:hypothetical protein C8T65DRAFT_831644 [Cerioporus squamosus]|nr:hypothetical protein C8T65DRAFT_831644 [Cerioporus squamosus]
MTPAESCHIHTLPIEVLLEIFEHFLILDKPYSDEGDLSSTTCLRLTGVCRYWRNLALNCPSLWTHIRIFPRTPSQWILFCLRHSLEAPLEVRLVELSKASMSEWFPALEDNIGRIRTLSVQAFVDFHFEDAMLQKLLHKKAPLLLTLRVAMTVPRGSEVVDFVAPPCPSLRCLSVTRMYVSWRQSGLTTLSSLKQLRLVRCIEEDGLRRGGGVESLSDVLDVLAACPLLEDVVIGESLPSLAANSAGQLLPVRMSKLTKLVLWERAETILLLLSYLHLREDVCLHLVPDRVICDGSPVTVRNMLPHSNVCLPILRGAVSVYVDKTGDIGNQTEITVLGEAGGKLTMTFIHHVPAASIFADLAELFSRSPLTQFRYHDKKDCRAFKDVWKAVFYTFPLIEDLDTSGGPNDIVDALQALSDVPDQPLLLPHLRRLAVASSDWSTDMTEGLLDCLRSRAMQGAPKLAQLRVETGRATPAESSGQEADGLVDEAIRGLKRTIPSLEQYSDVPVVHVCHGPRSA